MRIGEGKAPGRATAGFRPTIATRLVPPAWDALSIDLIRRGLETERVGFQLILYQEVGSTNEVLRRLAADGAREGTVVLAEAQRMGRGRLGQRALSPARVNLYASALFRPSMGPEAVPVFSFIAALAVSDAILAEGVSAAVRWPNDVLVQGGKVAGTSVVSATVGSQVDYVVLGVGVNVNVDRAALGDEECGATSLSEAAGRPIDRNAFAAAYLNHLERWGHVYRRGGPTAVLTAWRGRNGLAGRRVLVREAGRTHRGRVLGVNAHGEIVLETAPGAVRAMAGADLVMEA